MERKMKLEEREKKRERESVRERESCFCYTSIIAWRVVLSVSKAIATPQ